MSQMDLKTDANANVFLIPQERCRRRYGGYPAALEANSNHNKAGQCRLGYQMVN